MPSNDERIDDLLGLKPDSEYEEDNKNVDDKSGADESNNEEVDESGNEGDDDEREDDSDEDGDSDEDEEQEESTGEDEDESDGDDNKDKEENSQDRLKRENEGLKKAIVKLRQKNDQLAMKQRQQPVIPQYQQQQRTEPIKPSAPPKIMVKVDENGKDVLIDPESLEAWYLDRLKRDEEARSIPHPDQIKFARTQQATYNYIQEDPTNQTVVERVNMADDYFTAQITNLLHQGYKFTTIEEAVPLMQSLGIDKQALKMFPEIREVGFSEFISGLGSGDATSRLLIYKTVKRSMFNRSASPLSNVGKKTNNGAPRTLENSPRSLARKGGSRTSTPKTTEMAEFEDLYAEFQANGPLGAATMPKDKYDRMIKLGKKYKIEGLD